MNLKIAYFYQEELNLYGDTGNVEILKYRAEARGFDVEVVYITSTTGVTSSILKDINIVFMGGGPDSGQKDMYQDLLENKGPYLKDYIEKGGVALFICGSYQLLGNYYQSADGSHLQGLEIFDLYTQHFGHDKPRCVGNTVCKLSETILKDSVFKSVNTVGDTIVGFENHGGRTYLGNNTQPFANVLRGFGNNGEDKTEGVHHKNAIGTYFHGPILSKNPHIADYLIAKSLKLDNLIEIDNSLIASTHSALLKRFK